MVRKIFRIIGILLLAVIVLVGALLLWLTLTEYKPAATEDVTPTAGTASSAAPAAGDSVSILSWNIGYAGLGKGSDFFMLREKYEPEVWGYVLDGDGDKVFPLTHWENLLGRAKSADVSLSDPSVSRVHAVLIRNDKGLWRLYDTFSKGGAWVNAKNAEDEEGAAVRSGDTLALADKELVFEDISPAKRAELEKDRTPAGRNIGPGLTLLGLTVFQAFLALEHSVTADADHMEKRIEKLKTSEKPAEARKMTVKFKEREFLGDEVLVTDGLSKAFGGRRLFSGLTVTVEGKERIALIGDNGAGKSTLVKMILNQEPPDSGYLYLGPTVKTGYLPQIVTFENLSRSCLDTMSGCFRSCSSRFVT